MLERFKEIFAGLETAFGYSQLTGEKRETGKHETESRAFKDKLTDKIWKQHLDGTLMLPSIEGNRTTLVPSSLGIYLIKDDKYCKYGCIDVDIYNLDHQEIVKKIKDKRLPLILIKSKSGGAHIYLFTKTFVPASLVRDRLHKIKAVLGVASREIFPKQDEARNEYGELGSWINLPYYNAKDTERYAFGENGEKLDLEKFIAYHDQVVLSEKELTNLNLIDSSINTDEKHELYGAPPCLVTLLSNKIKEGTRNEMLYNIGVYLKKRFPENWQSETYQYNKKYMETPLGDSEVQNIAKSLNLKSYRYKCKQEPIHSCCDAKSCVLRKFGVGEHAPPPEIKSLSVIPSDPPQYLVTVDGKIVQVDEVTLHDPNKFSMECMKQIYRPLPKISENKWRYQLNTLFTTKTILPAPDSTKIHIQIAEILKEYIAQGETNEDTQLDLGLVLRDNDKYYFKFKDFFSHLRNTDFNTKLYPKHKTITLLQTIFKAEEVRHKNIRCICLREEELKNVLNGLYKDQNQKENE